MKKIGIIAGAIALVIGLCSCGPKPNANGWYQDFEQAKKDVLRFIDNKDSVLIWSKEFFFDIIKKLKFA